MIAYLDNGATTKVAKEVLIEMNLHHTKKYGNASSLHSFGQEAKDALELSRKIIAEKINANPEEIIFTASGTESDNMAIKGSAHYAREKTGKNHIICSKIEHPAVLHACQALEKEGFSVTYLDVDKDGFIDIKKLEQAITGKTILVSIMHANNEIGTIQDIEKIGAICSKKGVLFHTDAVQSFTKLPIDVIKQHLDLLSISAHKIHGPKGVGALFVRKGVHIRQLIHGGGQEQNMRSGTENIPGIAGFAKAAGLIHTEDILRMQMLRDKIINAVLKISETRLNGPRNSRFCSNANFSFMYVEGESLVLSLSAKGIAASTGSACSSHSLTASHVLLSIGLSPEIAHGSLRITLSKYTADAEVDYFLKILPQVVARLRKMSALNKKNINSKFDESDENV